MWDYCFRCIFNVGISKFKKDLHKQPEPPKTRWLRLSKKFKLLFSE